ncbi:MAG TPA: glycerophosphodiester phosphodiesterase [Enterococcus faecalis]|nr:glycerophosphodiester phosphodiesterase [Enterococcus faecalis]
MSAWQTFKNGTRQFFKDILQYLWLFFTLNVLLLLVGGAFSWATSNALKTQGIPYLSFNNLNLLLEKPLALVLLILLLLLFLGAVFYQFTFLLLGIFQIRQDHRFHFKGVTKASFKVLKKQGARSWLFFFGYFVVIVPFGNLIFQSNLLTKFVIPDFIVEFLSQRIPYLVGLLAFGLLVWYLAIRFIYTLPLMILERKKAGEAVKASWSMTNKRLWFIIRNIAFVTIAVFVSTYVIYVLLYLLQLKLDTLSDTISLLGGILNLTVVQFLQFVSNAWLSVLLINFLYTQLNVQAETTKKVAFDKETKRNKLVTIGMGLGLFTIFGGYIIFNAVYLTGLLESKPLIISHRGVTNSNGVQNTIPAMERTIKFKPDYIEIDVQETKDHQFIVMHDFNLRALTGVNKRPNQLTLKELTNMNVTENGQTAKMVSFDDYLAKANQLKQRLLIEIKTTPQDSPDLVQRFVKQYRENILENGHILHTLTYDTAMALKKEEPRFYVGYVIPFNIVGPPKMPVDFFTMEYSTMNRNFVNAAHHDGKKVYAWTANDEDVMTRMIFYGVDGIITDQLSLLNETMKTDLENPTYSDKLLNFAIGMG